MGRNGGFITGGATDGYCRVTFHPRGCLVIVLQSA